MSTGRDVLTRAALLVALGACSVLPGAGSSPTITTDKTKYAVGEIMTITGSGFTPNVQINVSVVRPDKITDYVVPIFMSDATGGFKVQYTPPSIPGRYQITATDGTSSAITASTTADAIGYNKAVYDKDNVLSHGGSGHWTTGNAGSNYLENQWVFYQYQVTGITSNSAVPSFDVVLNHYQPNTNAIFVDAFANFRACLDDCVGTNTSGPAEGMLADNVPFPPADTTQWKVATVGTAITKVNRPFVNNVCLDTPESASQVAEFHCFHVNGPALGALLPTITSGTHTVTLFYEAHLSSTGVWSQGSENNLGTLVLPFPEMVPNTIYGTDAYASWGGAVFSGVGFATGSSRHFEIDNQSAGSNGGLDLPIPTVPAPTGSITIVKVTNPSSATGAAFGFTGDLGGFTLDTDPATATPNSKTFSNLSGGIPFAVTESSMPDGWTLTGLSCASTSGTNTIGTAGATATITLDVAANSAVTCTYTNTESGTIRIIKNTVGGDGTFDFTGSGGAPVGNFSIATSGNAGIQVFNYVAPGTYTVAELGPPSGWLFTSLVCTTGGTATGQTATVNLAAGATVTCTFTNTKTGRITIRKNTVGDYGTFGFTSTGGTLPANFNITTSSGNNPASAVFTDVPPANYSVTETGPAAGWLFTSLSCSAGGTPSGQTANIVLPAGGDITCTFTNTKGASITIVKNTVGGNGTFAYTSTGGAAVPANFNITTTGLTGSMTFSPVLPGTYTVTEPGPAAGWQFTSLSCTAGGTPNGQAATIVVPAGGSVTCTYTNTRLPSLVVVKTTVGGNGTFAFTGTGSGVTSPFNLTGGQSITFQNIAMGTKTVAETVPAGWDLTGLVCALTTTGSGGSTWSITAPSASVSLAVGDTVTCTFTNSRRPTLKLVKNSLGGPATFDFTVAGPTAATPSITTTGTPNGTGSVGPTSIQVGAYTVSEQTPPAGWTMTDIACTAGSAGSDTNNDGIPDSWNFTANYGMDVVCTFTNSNQHTTRTQGFWATHTTLANAVWGGNGLPLPSNAASAVTGSADAMLCGRAITAIPATGQNILMGGFWAGISKTSTNKQRLDIDQARMQMLQQYLAAVLNVHMFGSGTPVLLSDARTAYCGTDIDAIKAQIGILGSFNQSGDTLPFDPGMSATTKTSKAQANIPFWDITE